jgi:hypothetical protein
MVDVNPQDKSVLPQNERSLVNNGGAEMVNGKIEPGTFQCSVFVRLVDAKEYKLYLSDPQRYPNPYPNLTSRDSKTH